MTSYLLSVFGQISDEAHGHNTHPTPTVLTQPYPYHLYPLPHIPTPMTPYSLHPYYLFPTYPNLMVHLDLHICLHLTTLPGNVKMSTDHRSGVFCQRITDPWSYFYCSIFIVGTSYCCQSQITFQWNLGFQSYLRFFC